MVKTQYALFNATEIDDFIFKRIDGVSFHPNPYIEIDDLCYIPILHYGFDHIVHHGEIICNKSISDSIISIFKLLLDKKYEIESVRLIDDFNGRDDESMTANNTSAFNYRLITNSDKLSYHALGLAIDINPLYNPYVKQYKGDCIILPKEAELYVNRKKRFPHKITHKDEAYMAFKKHGFTWGGDWKTIKDYQHFEKRL